MTKAKTTETTVTAGTRFDKDQVLAAQKYVDRRDLLAVLLDSGKSYTLTEVDAAIEEFLKKEVK